MRYLIPVFLLALPFPVLAGKNPVGPPPVFVPEIPDNGETPGTIDKSPVVQNPTTFVPPLGNIQSPGTAGQGPGAAIRSAAPALSDQEAANLVDRFQQATDFCRALPQQEYIVDCFAYEYWKIFDDLGDDGAQGELKDVIEQAATRLDRVVRQNRSAALPPAVARRGGAEPRVTDRPLIPVTSEALPQAVAEAADIIEEAQTVLIRSAENSERRRAQFQRVVASMETGTILLRSL